MELPANCVDLISLGLGDARDLLQCGLVSKEWRSIFRASASWQHAFVTFWSRRQKPAIIRTLWMELVDEALASTVHISITARPSCRRESLEPDQVQTSYLVESPSWYEKFVFAAVDTLTRAAPTKEELCYDCYFDQTEWDEQAIVPRLRCWYCFGSERLKDFPSEICFTQDGQVTPHDNRFQAACGWTWTWKFGEGDLQVLELTGVNGAVAGQQKVISFRATRTSDAGFVFESPGDGLMLCSREVSKDEHDFLNPEYGHDLFPPYPIESALEEMANETDGPSVIMPEALTKYEQWSVLQLAQQFKLLVAFDGPDRRIVVQRCQAKPRVQATWDHDYYDMMVWPGRFEH